MNEIPRTRPELVRLVQEVVGEVPKATSQYGMVRLYRGTKSLTLEYTAAHHILAMYCVPIPDATLRVIASKELNPYDNVQVSLRPSQSETLPGTPGSLELVLKLILDRIQRMLSTDTVGELQNQAVDLDVFVRGVLRASGSRP